MGTVASLDIDAQKGFTPLCPNELPVVGGDDIVAALNAQATLATLRGRQQGRSPRQRRLGRQRSRRHAVAAGLAQCRPHLAGTLRARHPRLRTARWSARPHRLRLLRLEGGRAGSASLRHLLPRSGRTAQHGAHRVSACPWRQYRAGSAASPPTTASRPVCCNCATPVSG